MEQNGQNNVVFDEGIKRAVSYTNTRPNSNIITWITTHTPLKNTVYAHHVLVGAIVVLIGLSLYIMIPEKRTYERFDTSVPNFNTSSQ